MDFVPYAVQLPNTNYTTNYLLSALKLKELQYLLMNTDCKHPHNISTNKLSHDGHMTLAIPPAHLPAWQFFGGHPGPDGVLNGLNLYGHHRQHGLLQTVELIKAAPGTALDQTNEDATRGLDVQALE